MSPARTDPYPAYNFLVEIDGVLKGSFSEVSGLVGQFDVAEYREGGDNTSIRKLQGLEKFSNITLKRGYTSDLSLWKWFRSFEQGVLQRTTMSITLLDEQHNPVLVWRVLRAWPCKYSGPLLNAKTSDVAIETLEICHEGIELAGP